MQRIVQHGLLFAAVLLMGLSNHVQCHGQQRIKISVMPVQALMDDRLTIRISELPPRRRITISAQSKSHDQHYWRSNAVFRAGVDGRLDLSAQAPQQGSYTGVDAMGLFWSMQPVKIPNRKTPAFFSTIDWSAPIITDIDVVCDGNPLGSVRVARHFAAPRVCLESVRSNGIVGVLYRPCEQRKFAGVIVMGGSEGGFAGAEAPMLASRGFVALSLAYFGTDGLPQSMQRIPVEYFGRAIRWMASRSDVDRECISLLGASRGAEAALIVGSLFPEVKAVVVASGSHVLWEGATARQMPGGSAWTYKGKPLPFVPLRISAGFGFRYLWSIVTGNGLAFTPMFLDSLGRSDIGPVEIPVESIQGPVLLGSGSDDHKWPSSMMSNRVMDRLRQNKHPFRDEYVEYAGAGHWLPSAYVPTAGLQGGMKEEIGGTAEATARVEADWWPRILRFLSALSARDSIPK